jgi:DDE superfamily endonuclease
MGRGWTFDDLEESTGVSAEVHRKFTHLFLEKCREKICPKYIRYPETEEEVKDAMAEFSEAGFHGCIGSTDATHVILEKCSASLKNMHLGGKLSQTARAYQITVNHRRRILWTTQGFPARWNDKTVVRFDKFVTGIWLGDLYANIEYSLFGTDGSQTLYRGLWLLVDNGYLSWSCTIPPYKEAVSEKELRWSRWAESVRKDVECTFGIMKGRFRVLKTGIRFNPQSADNLWFTCCALHNWLLEIDGLDARWQLGVHGPYEGEIGLHEVNHVRRIPTVFLRLQIAGDFRTHDPTGHAYHANILRQNVTQGGAHVSSHSIRRLDLESFRQKLVVHFDYLWRQRRIVWPSRTGRTEVVVE